MTDILSDLRAVANVNGDTYSSAEVIAMVRRSAEEIERLRKEKDEASEALGRLWQAGYNAAMMKAADRIRFSVGESLVDLADGILKMRRSFDKDGNVVEQI